MTCSSTLIVRAAIFEDGSATYTILWFFKTSEIMKATVQKRTLKCYGFSLRRYTDENMPHIHRDKTLEEYCSGGSGGHEGGHARSQPPTTPSSSTSASLGSFPGYNKKHSSPLHEYFNGVGKFGTVRGKALGESDINLSLRKSYLEC